jgi:hypothetical protein
MFQFWSLFRSSVSITRFRFRAIHHRACLQYFLSRRFSWSPKAYTSYWLGYVASHTDVTDALVSHRPLELPRCIHNRTQVTDEAVPKLRQLVADLPSQRPGFNHQGSPCGIFGGDSGTEAVYSAMNSVSPANYYFTTAPYPSSVLGLYNMPILSHSIKGISFVSFLK